MPVSMEIWQGLGLFLIGIIAGFINVMAGGGSLLSVPVMVFMGMPGPVANGTNRIAILAQNLSATLTFFKKGLSDFKLSLTLSLCAIPGAIAGAYAGTRLEGIWFNRILALIMLGVMVLMTFSKDTGEETPGAGDKPRNLLAGHLMMVLVGCYGGFIQLGVGFIIMAVLNRIMGLNLVLVNMHKTFIIMNYTLAALIVYAYRVDILWILGCCLATGNAVGGWLGATYTIRKGERAIKIVLNIVLTIFIIKLVFF